MNDSSTPLTAHPQGESQSPVVLSATGLSVVLGGKQVLDQVDVEVRAGEFVGLIGSNGAGKTTLLRVLLGALAPTSGVVNRPDRHHGAIGYVPQKVNLAPDVPLRVRDMVALGADGGRLGLPLHRAKLAKQVNQVLDAVGASEFADQRIGELSGGQQQRALLAHALMCDPVLLLLDEPLANLDPASSHDIVGVLDELCRRTGVAIMMTAHDMNVLLPVMDRLVYLANGKAASGRPQDVIRPDVLSKLYGQPIEVVEAGGHAMVFAEGGEHHLEETHHLEPQPRMTDEITS